ncbi:MAG: formylmethanofuran dehydrogenase subunit C [Planctomycetaceae bacterium]|nr:formylmethanofuran dehydrogenase subunit C [Planctomycetaceae bacterium]
MFKLTLRVPSSIPLELDGITPDHIANLSALEVAKLPVQHGNRTEPLGEFFTIGTDTFPKADLQFAGDTRNVKGIGAGMSSGFIYVENDVGMHAGARMSGGELVIDSGAGDWLGAEMRGGSIEVRGDAGNQVGAAYRGSRRGVTGGSIFIRGSAGDELGLLMRRGLIVVERDCGEFAGASLIAGTIALFGKPGLRLGAGMKRGTIITTREPELPPSFHFACEYRPSILHLIAKQLAAVGAVPSFGKGFVRCYRGDVLTGGRGEVLVTNK